MKFIKLSSYALRKARTERLLHLVRHQDITVRRAVVSNPDVPNGALLEVIDDTDPVVCGTALWRLFRRREGTDTPFLVVEEKHLLTSTLVNRICNGDNEWWFPRWVLASYAKDQKILRKLFNKGGWNTYLALANNPACPDDLLIRLAKLPKEPSERLPDRFKEIREIAGKRLGVAEKINAETE